MRWMLPPLVLAVSAALTAPAHAPNPSGAARSLADAERAFARDARERDTRAAFLAVLDDSGVVFRPRAVNGRAAVGARPANAALLAWEPELVEVGATGDLGYTTGPWTFHPGGRADTTVAAAGHYVSVWRRSGDGAWRLVADAGHEHARVAAAPLALRVPARVRGSRPGAGPRRRDALLAHERDFQARASAGHASALVGELAADGRVCRNGALPAVGPKRARALLGADAPSRGTPLDSGVAASDDLGWTHGVLVRGGAAGAGADTASYLRVWRREGGTWKVAVDLEVPWR